MTRPSVLLVLSLLSLSLAEQNEQFGGQQAYDAEHIKEHLSGKVDPATFMTPEQLQFHYFNMYDLDKNSRLDGNELIKVITHFHAHANQEDKSQPPPLPSELELEQLVDSILTETDYDHNGLIDYGEFVLNQKIREQKAKET